ncbi:hypothetical protein CPC08DRAFT_715183 [Agrocybe pediades]|nr:hypothetical protein CPC08DRAFT_715183 [Agrocybe pediades]
MSPPECLFFLMNCLALESLTILIVGLGDGLRPEASLNDTGAFTTFTKLTHLYLYETPRTMESVWSYMTAPNLKDLSLSPVGGPDDRMRWTNSLIQFIRRSSCSLEHVLVRDVPTVCAHALLEEAKTATRFSVLSHPNGQQVISNTLLSMLNSSQHGSCHLPELEELSLKGVFRTNIDTLLDMIKSRVPPPFPRNGQCPVKKIRKINIIYHNTGLTEDVEPDALRRFYGELQSLSTSTGTSIEMAAREITWRY